RFEEEPHALFSVLYPLSSLLSCPALATFALAVHSPLPPNRLLRTITGGEPRPGVGGLPCCCTNRTGRRSTCASACWGRACASTRCSGWWPRCWGGGSTWAPR